MKRGLTVTVTAVNLSKELNQDFDTVTVAGADRLMQGGLIGVKSMVHISDETMLLLFLVEKVSHKARVLLVDRFDKLRIRVIFLLVPLLPAQSLWTSINVGPCHELISLN